MDIVWRNREEQYGEKNFNEHKNMSIRDASIAALKRTAGGKFFVTHHKERKKHWSCDAVIVGRAKRGVGNTEHN